LQCEAERIFKSKTKLKTLSKRLIRFVEVVGSNPAPATKIKFGQEAHNLMQRFVAFLNQNFILISKTTRAWDCVTSFLIPLFAKNSRLGYFFYANNPQPKSNIVKKLLRIKFAYANLALS
jgi:hypothetical protein